MRTADDFGDLASLRRAFCDPPHAEGPLLYLPLGEAGADADGLLAAYKKCGYAGVIPYYPSEGAARPFGSDWPRALCGVYAAAAEYGMTSGYLDDATVMSAYLAADGARAAEMGCRVLNVYEYECSPGERVSRPLGESGVLMSLTAVETDRGEILDLRPFVTPERRLEWTAPAGNWLLQRFVCEPQRDAREIRLLDYDVCRRYFAQSCGAALDALDEETRGAVCWLILRNVQFGGRNRRIWSERFNEEFAARFGEDPAPLYPCLFRDAGPAPLRARARLMACRAAMLTDGYCRAAADFAAARGMTLTGYAVESKAAAGSWLFGDGMRLHAHTAAPGFAMPFGYLYGISGAKIAAGAAEMYGRGLVCADMFRRYPPLEGGMLRRESMNVFLRGANCLMLHLGEARQALETEGARGFFSRSPAAEYADFCARAQLLLRGGRHVCDVAVLYPIDSIHAQTCLYDLPEDGFAYPATPENEDYMAVMNDLLSAVCRDAVFLHPDVFTDGCTAQDGWLYRAPERGGGRFSIVILPGTVIVSVRVLRQLCAFFDGGGRVLATGCLPRAAVEAGADGEVRALCAHLFGGEALDGAAVRPSFENRSESGGRAVFLPSIHRAADGVNVVPAAALSAALDALGGAPDVWMADPPRIEYGGVVSYNWPTYRRVGVGERLLHSGSLGCLHKKTDLCDVYFFANTAASPYEGDVLLRGRHAPETWDPLRGKTRRLEAEPVRFRGAAYTRVRLTLDASACVFLISPNLPRTAVPLSAEREAARPYPDPESNFQ